MSRKIIQIDQEKCVGCGLCANACQQSAIEMVNGKATVVRDDYCDGIGNCLPVCPVNAISFSDRDIINTNPKVKSASHSCPGSDAKKIEREHSAKYHDIPQELSSNLNQWPVQIKLVSPQAPYFEQANLLVAADCAAYAYANFHSKFMKNKITIIGCPKLDVGNYAEKLTEIIRDNSIKSVTVVRMEVPCCGGIEEAVKTALINSKKMIPWQVVTLSTDGIILEN
ncbi:MAG: ATP-binding protein [Lachnospiraceae bacterium]